MIKSKREACEVRQITDIQEFQQELFKKIREEANSLAMVRTKEEFLAEYADLMTVFDTIMKQLEITAEEVAEVRQANLLKKGGFKHQYFLLWSEDVNYQSNESPQGIPL
jgi:predicted house-cleaning noncanonical NTP pyrophosphatase (MazG superfamily)